MLEHARKVTSCEWWSRVKANCRTDSGKYWPIRDPEAYEYTCKASEFLKELTYLVCFTSKDGSRIVAFDDPEATAITVADFVKNELFVQHILNGCNLKEPVLSAQLLVQKCTSCQRRLVIDGVHRLVYIASQGILNADLYVTELAGSEWPSEMPDLRVICACKVS